MELNVGFGLVQRGAYTHITLNHHYTKNIMGPGTAQDSKTLTLYFNKKKKNAAAATVGELSSNVT
ncbi:fimbrial protein, partial [Enterobacter hormaechei]